MRQRIGTSIALAAAILCLASRVSGLREQSPPTNRAALSLDAQLSAAGARGDVPGRAVIAATRERVIYQGAFGMADAGNRRAMTPDALFRIASMTKAVTSVAAMQLFEQKRFGLDDPVE